jgi:hypothetical protein
MEEVVFVVGKAKVRHLKSNPLESRQLHSPNQECLSGGEQNSE